MEIRRATKTISLALIGSMAVFFGFKSCYDADPDWASTTQPSGGHHTGGHYWSTGSRSSSGSSGSHFSGTSRGGFGGSGHFSGS